MNNDASESNKGLQNAAIIGTALEILVRSIDKISGEAIASGVDGKYPVLCARADMGAAAIRGEIQKRSLAKGK